jgi:hypothetical protein
MTPHLHTPTACACIGMVCRTAEEAALCDLIALADHPAAPLRLPSGTRHHHAVWIVWTLPGREPDRACTRIVRGADTHTAWGGRTITPQSRAAQRLIALCEKIVHDPA